jgi:hypothetical protein
VVGGNRKMSLGPSQTVTLDRDTIGVLFELLGRWVEDGQMSALQSNFEHDAEAWALNDLYCMLEAVVDPGIPGGCDGARSRLMEFHGNIRYPT